MLEFGKFAWGEQWNELQRADLYIAQRERETERERERERE